jgi:Flp pilus assembly secretin CpaC
MYENNKKLVGIFLIIALGSTQDSVAAMTGEDFKPEPIEVILNKSVLKTVAKDVVEISQGNPAIADNNPGNARPGIEDATYITVIPPKQILIRGKSLGTTNLYLWGDGHKLLKALCEIEWVIEF